MSRRKGLPKMMTRGCRVLPEVRPSHWRRMSRRKRAACMRLCRRGATVEQVIDAGCM